MVLRLGFLASVLVAGGFACTSSSGAPPASACPQELPNACPANAPSYANDALPIFERRCFACHTNGGLAGPRHDFSTYDQIYAQRLDILDQLNSCLMPPADAAAPSEAERATLLTWLVCKAPNN
jgi:hypothetical protein